MAVEYNEADDEWETYIGLLYYKVIESIDDYKNLKTIVELAPGFRYKIAYALQKINFDGNLYIVDNNEKVLEYIKQKYTQLLPNAKIFTICESFENCSSYLPDNIDLLLSNHCVDDMIMNEYLKTNNENKNLEYKELFTKCWYALNLNKELTNKIIDKIYDNFKTFFDSKKTKYVVMAQYQSNKYFKDVINEYKISWQLFNKIKKLTTTDDNELNEVLKYHPFGDDERYLGDYLLVNTQNAKNWICGKIK